MCMYSRGLGRMKMKMPESQCDRHGTTLYLAVRIPS
jgi:hypothetical protein